VYNLPKLIIAFQKENVFTQKDIDFAFKSGFFAFLEDLWIFSENGV
jgi:hypothetical protein